MRSGILRARIAALRLNPQAPFPSQIRRRQCYQMRALRAIHATTYATIGRKP